MRKSELGFIGEIEQPPCPCHQDKFVVFVYLVDPVQGRLPVAVSEFYDTMEIASQKLDGIVKEVGLEIIKTHFGGSNVSTLEMFRGDEAQAAEQRIYKEKNPTLH